MITARPIARLVLAAFAAASLAAATPARADGRTVLALVTTPDPQVQGMRAP